VNARPVARAGSSVEGSASSNFGRRLKADVESIAQAVDELTRLVGGIAQPVRLQPVDVTRVIEAAVAELQACLRNKDQEVELCMADALPAVEADPSRLREVVAHLLINAYLASPVGARIEVRASHSNGPSDRTDNLTGDGGDPFVVVSVRDCGGGLQPEALGDVFDRTRPVRIPQGLGASGADLAAVRSLVEIQHGRVWVETESGAGTTFSLALPVQGQG
jgi:signal transduction histidine kinase